MPIAASLTQIKMKQFLTIIMLSLIPVLAKSRDNKEKADGFFRVVVKTYFDRDCDRFYSFFYDSVAIISPNGVGVYSTKEKIKTRKACSKFKEFTEGFDSLDDYLNHYQIIVLDKKEFTSKSNDTIKRKISAEETDNLLVYEVLQEFGNNFTDSDYLVFGNIRKTDKSKSIENGVFWMIVRKTQDGWKIFGTQA
jgi:hypothetical protein